jgi:hypothetical protein
MLKSILKLHHSETIQLVKREIGAIPGFELEYFTPQRKTYSASFKKTQTQITECFIVVDLVIRLVDNIYIRCL